MPRLHEAGATSATTGHPPHNIGLFFVSPAVDGESTFGGVNMARHTEVRTCHLSWPLGWRWLSSLVSIARITREISWTRILRASDTCPSHGDLVHTNLECTRNWHVFLVGLDLKRLSPSCCSRVQTRTFRAGVWSTWKHMKLSANPLVDAVDWTRKGVVISVKNNGQCGLCLAFGSSGSPSMCLVLCHFQQNAAERAAASTATRSSACLSDWKAWVWFLPLQSTRRGVQQ